MKRLLSLLWPRRRRGRLPFPQIALAGNTEYGRAGGKARRGQCGAGSPGAPRDRAPKAAIGQVWSGAGGTIGPDAESSSRPRRAALATTGDPPKDCAIPRKPTSPYAVKYLAGAYRAANGNHNRAVAYYAGGYYWVAKTPAPRNMAGIPNRCSLPWLLDAKCAAGFRPIAVGRRHTDVKLPAPPLLHGLLSQTPRMPGNKPGMTSPAWA